MRPASQQAPRLTGALALVLATGCVPLHHELPDATAGRVVTAAQIEATGARTAWEALRQTMPQLNFDFGGIHHRGESSVVLVDAVAVILDGARLADYRSLVDIPARDVLRIQYLSGINGTTYYGHNSGDGVLVIETKRGG